MQSPTFITSSPASDSFRKTVAAGDVSRARDLEAEQASLRNATAQAAVVNNAALEGNIRREMGVPSQGAAPEPIRVAAAPMAAVQPRPRPAPQPIGDQATGLRKAVSRAQMATPGHVQAGAEGMISAQDAQEKREREELKTILNAAKSDPAGAMAMARRLGVDLPPEFQNLLADRTFTAELEAFIAAIEKGYANETQKGEMIAQFISERAGDLQNAAHGGSGAPAMRDYYADLGTPEAADPTKADLVEYWDGTNMVRGTVEDSRGKPSAKPTAPKITAVGGLLWKDNLPLNDEDGNQRKVPKTKTKFKVVEKDGSEVWYMWDPNVGATRMEDGNEKPLTATAKPTPKITTVKGFLFKDGELIKDATGNPMREPKDKEKFKVVAADGSANWYSWDAEAATASPIQNNGQGLIAAAAPTIKKSDLVEVVGDNHEAVLVPASEAAGRTPWRNPDKPAADKISAPFDAGDGKMYISINGKTQAVMVGGNHLPAKAKDKTGNISKTIIKQDAEGYYVAMNPYSGAAHDITTEDGQRIKGPLKSATGAGTKGGVFEHKRQAWLAIYEGDEAGALEFARGTKGSDPAKIRSDALKLISKQETAKLAAGEIDTMPTHAEMVEAANKIVSYILPEQKKPTAKPSAAPAGEGVTKKAQDGNDYPVISNKAQYDALAAGSVYYNAEQKKFVKKGN
jgi:hypothetical protein